MKRPLHDDRRQFRAEAVGPPAFVHHHDPVCRGRGRDHGVKVALELHPQNLVFNTRDVRKLIALTGATNIGVELDASHLFWQQMDPIAVVRELGPLIFHAAAKDVRINPEYARLYGVEDPQARVRDLLEAVELKHRRLDVVRTFSRVTVASGRVRMIRPWYSSIS